MSIYDHKTPERGMLDKYAWSVFVAELYVFGFRIAHIAHQRHP